MHQHFVGDHLKKQRRDQRKNLQHKRHRQHFKQQLAVFDDGGDKPAEIKPRRLRRQKRRRAHEDQRARAARSQHLAADDFRAAHGGVLNQHPFAIDTGDDEKLAIHTLRDRGQGRGIQPREVGVCALRLEFELPCGEQDFIHPETATRRHVLMR